MSYLQVIYFAILLVTWEYLWVTYKYLRVFMNYILNNILEIDMKIYFVYSTKKVMRNLIQVFVRTVNKKNKQNKNLSI